MSERSSKNTRVLGVLAPPPTGSGQISFVSRLARLQKHRAQHLHCISGAMAGSTLLPGILYIHIISDMPAVVACSGGFILCLWNFMLGAKPGVD